MDFAEIVKILRIIGPNIRLLSVLTKHDEKLLFNFLKKVPYLEFTPITKITSLSIKEDGKIRRSIKNNKGVSIQGNLKVKEIRNFSGVAEAFNILTDDWDLSLDKRGNYVSILPDEFARHETVSTLKYLSLKEPLASMVRSSVIKGFIVDYGKRDFYVDVLTYDLGVIEVLEYIPFIRYEYVLINEEDLPLYLVELFVPERYFKVVIKTVKEICEANKCQIIVATDSFFSSKRII
ncbi:hypothetical protein SJAV_04690 [Sulfurisphaera javensis]|uniref:Uncharacterized protein n=1 Tax=Sulfurisphaera javensis TaxID=2049879 RepID=A0AAT9GP28_9CREN